MTPSGHAGPPRSLADAVLRPRAVAVVGASSDPRKRGYQAVRALGESGYRGRIHPVHPGGGELLGHPVSPSLAEVPGPVDLALVCTPARSAPGIVADCGRAGVPVAVLLAVGFGESGTDGSQLEADVLSAARAAGVRLIGPNTSGLMNLPEGVNLIGARGVRAGDLGLLVQSGNLALNLMLDATRRSAGGLSVAVGVGNEIDLGFADFVEWLADDPATAAVLVHAEGLRDGARVLAAAASAARRKPVVMLKAARSEAGGSAARSHTGAVAGRYEALRAGLRQAGVVEVVRSDELFHVGQALAHQPPARVGGGLAILSDGGGQGTLAVDTLEARGLELASLAAPTRAALRALLGPAAAVSNPVDLAGAADADPRRFVDALEALVADPAVGAVLVVGLFGGYARRFDPGLADAEVAAAVGMAGVARDAGVGLVVHTMFAPDATPPLVALQDDRVPVIESLEVACRAAEALIERRRHLDAPPWSPVTDVRPAGRTEPRALSEPEARERFAGWGVPLVEARLAGSADEAVEIAEALGGPVALKAVAHGLTHKTEAGGVALGLEGADAVRSAWSTMVGRVARHLGRGDAWVGALVSPHLPPPVAELLVGAHRDPQLGTVVTLGAGGTWVEVLADVALRLPPVDLAEARSMAAELRIAPILEGHRGRAAGDLDAVARVVVALSDALVDDPTIAEAEVNPLFVYADRVVAVDARAYVTPRPGAQP